MRKSYEGPLLEVGKTATEDYSQLEEMDELCRRMGVEVERLRRWLHGRANGVKIEDDPKKTAAGMEGQLFKFKDRLRKWENRKDAETRRSPEKEGYAPVRGVSGDKRGKEMREVQAKGTTAAKRSVSP